MKTIKLLVASLALSLVITSCSKDEENLFIDDPVVEGAIVTTKIGGYNEPNQVFFDLSKNKQETVRRDTWSLGFDTGDDFNVIINHTNYSAAGSTESLDIDKLKESDFDELKEVATLMSDPKYVDDPEGDVTKNAIGSISSNPENNKVYLLNLGTEIGEGAPGTDGGVNVAGQQLGYRKIRIIRQDGGYLLQYAKLSEKTHKQVFIKKGDSKFAYTYFDFKTEKIVNVSPQLADWDISFTVFTNVINSKDGPITYGYSDFVLSNKRGGVKIFAITNNSEFAEKNNHLIEKGLLEKNINMMYKDFSKNDLVSYESKLSNTRTMPGSIWRNVFTKETAPLFFIIKDADGNFYKLRFLNFLNVEGNRGYTEFEYNILN